MAVCLASHYLVSYLLARCEQSCVDTMGEILVHLSCFSYICFVIKGIGVLVVIIHYPSRRDIFFLNPVLVFKVLQLSLKPG